MFDKCRKWNYNVLTDVEYLSVMTDRWRKCKCNLQTDVESVSLMDWQM